jgi:uncharacterized membrane protein YciS (DUF1049 family)
LAPKLSADAAGRGAMAISIHDGYRHLSVSYRRLSVAARVGLILAVCALITIAVMIVVDPNSRTVTPNYIIAAGNFVSRQNLYNPQLSGGYLYLPTFAVMFVPITVFGVTICNLVWRAICLVALWLALARAVRRLNTRSDHLEIVGVALLFALFGAADAVRIGQTTTVLLAVTFLAFDAAYDRRFAAAAIWATLAVIAKPLGIVVWLLIGGTRPKSLPWLASFLAMALLAPFAFAEAKYVDFLYTQFIAMLSNVAPEQGRYAEWADFMALVRATGLSLDGRIVDAIRIVAAIVTFIAAFAAMREKDYLRASVIPATLACSYMLLFNPRAELSTYILMAIPYGLLAAYMLRETRQRIPALAVGAACIGLGTGILGVRIMHALNPWSKPLLLIFAIGVCAFALLRSREDHEGAQGAPSSV